MKKLISILLAALMLLSLAACGGRTDAAETTEITDSAEPAAADTAGSTDTAETYITGTEDAAVQTAAEQAVQALADGGYSAEADEPQTVDHTDSAEESGVDYGADAVTYITVSGGSGEQESYGVTVYDYASAEDAEQASQGFDPEDPSAFGLNRDDGTSVGMIVDYIAPITLYLSGSSIVLYCGYDAAVRELLTAAFGEPFAGDAAE